ncbi:hypothetical protein Gohar_025727 [Gossypium harknessii]|uniref:Uncharacterized protein n=2 Tax=Gossypium harknessii TaxID=34285 RepID=A0A7J9IAD3_9ROSI|nr:hypothetical protein [Gossypium harknessii]
MKDVASVLPNIGHGVRQGKSSSRRHSLGELIYNAFRKCNQRVVTALCKAKDKISDIAYEANKLNQATSGTVHEAKEKVKDKAWETVQEGQDVKERVKESIDKANEAATTIEDTAKTMGDDIVTNTSKQVENVQEKAMEDTVQAANKVKTSTNKFLDGLKYMTSMEALNTVMGIANLLGLATTYGMSV